MLVAAVKHVSFGDLAAARELKMDPRPRCIEVPFKFQTDVEILLRPRPGDIERRPDCMEQLAFANQRALFAPMLFPADSRHAFDHLERMLGGMARLRVFVKCKPRAE